MPNEKLLMMSLEASVFLRVAKFKRAGGPTEADRKRIGEFANVLAERGRVLIHGSPVKDEVAEVFNGLADAISVLAFAPGGVTFNGRKWEASGEAGGGPPTGEDSAALTQSTQGKPK